MTIAHIGMFVTTSSLIFINIRHWRVVLFKFRADVAEAVREEFLSQIKTLKNLPCVKSQRLIVGGPSITTPIEKSKGFQYALVSYHENREALDEYHASSEHHRYGSPNTSYAQRLNESIQGDKYILYPLQGGSRSI
jgi:hypothetical protein